MSWVGQKFLLRLWVQVVGAGVEMALMSVTTGQISQRRWSSIHLDKKILLKNMAQFSYASHYGNGENTKCLLQFTKSKTKKICQTVLHSPYHSIP
jgi:hypothetical protein